MYSNVVTQPELPEKVENRRHTVAMKLLEKVVEEFGSDSFTLEDVRDAFNDRVKREGFGLRFGEGGLEYLRKMGALDYDPKTDSYTTNPNNKHVMRIVMDDEDFAGVLPQACITGYFS